MALFINLYMLSVRRHWQRGTRTDNTGDDRELWIPTFEEEHYFTADIATAESDCTTRWHRLCAENCTVNERCRAIRPDGDETANDCTHQAQCQLRPDTDIFQKGLKLIGFRRLLCFTQQTFFGGLIGF